jgi:hypothetical protein
MSDTYLLSVQDHSLNEFQIWRLVGGFNRKGTDVANYVISPK